MKIGPAKRIIDIPIPESIPDHLPDWPSIPLPVREPEKIPEPELVPA
jgi:hypothetical protein